MPNPVKSESDRKVSGLYDGKRAPRWILRLIQFVGAAALILTGFAFYRAPDDHKAWLQGVWVFWVIAPPAWFALEYFYVYRTYGSGHNLSEYQAGQDVMAKFWVAIVALISGALAPFGA